MKESYSHHYKSGFTIIEVVIAGMLMVILGFGIFGLQRLIQSSQITGFNSYVNVDEANFVVSQMAREMRTMRAAQNGAYPLVFGGDNDISFYSDINFNGESELVRYYLDGNALKKSVIEPTGFPATYPPANATIKTLTENIQNGGDPLFLYFNENWPADTTNNPLATPVSLADVHLIRIFLNINSSPNYTNQAYELSTSVELRTLKSNL